MIQTLTQYLTSLPEKERNRLLPIDKAIIQSLLSEERKPTKEISNDVKEPDGVVHQRIHALMFNEIVSEGILGSNGLKFGLKIFD